MIRAPHPRRATLTGRCQNRLTGRAGILQLRGHRGGSLWRRSRSPSPQKPWEGKTEPGGHDSRHPGVLRRAAAPCHGGGRAGLLGAAQLQLRVPLRSLRGAPQGKTAQNWEKKGKKGEKGAPKAARPRRFSPKPAARPAARCAGPPAPISPASLSGPPAAAAHRPHPPGGSARPRRQRAAAACCSRPPFRLSAPARPARSPVTRRAAPTGAGRWDYNSQEAAGLGRDVTRLSANPEGGGNGRPSVRGLRARGAAPCLGTAFFP